MKELGFDEPCFMIYYNGTDEMRGESHFLFGRDTKAPTFSQAFRFFREKYDLQCWIHDGGYVGKCCIKITGYNHDKFYFSSSEPMEYEEAELACLRRLIEIVN